MVLQATAPAVAEDTAPPAEAPPETQILAPETESAPVVPETETAPSDAGTESGSDPLADLTPEQLRDHPSVKAILETVTKDVEARQAESYRQRQLTAETQAKERADAEAYARNLAELDAVDRGSLMEGIHRVLDAAIDPTIDPEARQRLNQQLPVLRQIAEAGQRSAITRIDRQTIDIDNDYLSQNFPEYRVPTDVIAKYDRAMTQGDRRAQRAVLNDIIAAAAVEKAKPGIESAAVKTLKAEAEATLQNSQRQATEKAATANGGPTNVAGRTSTGLQFANRREVAKAHVDGLLTNQQARQLYAQPHSVLPE